MTARFGGGGNQPCLGASEGGGSMGELGRFEMRAGTGARDSARTGMNFGQGERVGMYRTGVM